jgi:uncharacterized protein YdcH (DUF465 family)
MEISNLGYDILEDNKKIITKHFGQNWNALLLFGGTVMPQSINRMIERIIRYQERLSQKEVKFQPKNKLNLKNVINKLNENDNELDDSIYSELFKDEIVEIDLN